MRRSAIKIGLVAALGAALYAGCGDKRDSKTVDNHPENPVVVRQLDLEDYGSVEILRPQTDRILYIVSQAHRAGRERIAPEEVAVAHQEIYNIGEFLIKNRNVRLILNEGCYANDKKYQNEQQEILRELADVGRVLREKTAEDTILREIFRTTRIDAPFLLKVVFPEILLDGHETQYWYDSAVLLKDLPRTDEEINRLFRYANDHRSCEAIQNSIALAHQYHDQYKIPNLNAMVVIGDSHLEKIREVVREDNCHIDGLRTENPPTNLPETNTRVDLEERGYGVVIVRPRSITKEN